MLTDEVKKRTVLMETRNSAIFNNAAVATTFVERILDFFVAISGGPKYYTEACIGDRMHETPTQTFMQSSELSHSVCRIYFCDHPIHLMLLSSSLEVTGHILSLLSISRTRSLPARQQQGIF